MPDATFRDENSAIAYVRKELEESLPRPLASAIAEHLVIRCKMDGPVDDWPYEPPGTGEFTIGAPFFGTLTVREAELYDIKDLALGLLAYYASPNDLNLVVGLAVSGACMLWRLRRRGVHAGPLQLKILLALRAAGKLKLDQIVHRISGQETTSTVPEVEEALKELSAIRLNDGNVVALVYQDREGHWSTDARGLWEVPFGAVG